MFAAWEAEEPEAQGFWEHKSHLECANRLTCSPALKLNLHTENSGGEGAGSPSQCLSCSEGTGDRGEGWIPGRRAGAARAGAPQPALPLHRILLCLLEACLFLVCTPQLESWPGPSPPQACTAKLRIRG